MKYLFLLTGACIMLGSCSTGDAASAAAAKIFGRSSQALIFLECRAAADQQVEFDFSHPVTIKSLSFSPELAVGEIEDGATVKVMLEETPAPGILVTADLIAEDENKNSINVIVTFRARNNRMPQLLINEIRTEYSNPRVEFIEFKVKKAGNLGAVRVFMAGASQAPSSYEFAPAEVNEGEYIVLHLRKREDLCKDEYGSNLTESGGTGSSGARDIWVPGVTKLINKTAGFVYLLDQDGKVINAVMFSDNQNPWWTKDYLAQAAEFLFNQGAWKSPDGGICSPADAVSSLGTTATRTICRDETAENSNTAEEWYISATSSATPGEKNNVKRYEP